MAVGEFDLIQRYFSRESLTRGVALGVGDDCALLEVPAGCLLAVSMDTLVEGVHFPRAAEPALVAERALRVNLSDLAAMGAEPLWFTLGLTLPTADENWVAEFAAGLWHAAEQHQIALVGGDTTKGPLTITLQVHGAVPAGKALTRDGAQSGDHIFVSGSLGEAAAALAWINGELTLSAKEQELLLSRYYRPEPRLSLGQALRGIASAAIDISDGLVADLGHICERSNVKACLQVENLPLSDQWRSRVSQEQGTHWALSGGDDYELCFTVSPERLPLLTEVAQTLSIAVTRVGTITPTDAVASADTRVVCQQYGQPFELRQKGYQHFHSDDPSA